MEDSEAEMEGDLEEARNAEAARRLQDVDYEAHLLSDELLTGPKLVEEQAYIWQQLHYQRQADTIQRKRQEQSSRHDSTGDTWTTSSPRTSPGIHGPSPQTTRPSASFATTSSDRNSAPPSWARLLLAGTSPEEWQRRQRIHERPARTLSS